MLAQGIANVIVCDRRGTIYPGRTGLTAEKEALASRTNPDREGGTPAEALVGADVFLGLSGPDVVTPEAIRSMNTGAIVFALANPVPEVQPEAVRDYVAIMATGRSDYPNQINNVLAFPGVFRGALDVRASTINEEMKLAAAQAIAGVISEDELNPEYIIPSVFNRAVSAAVAGAVAQAAATSGVARSGRATRAAS
jgi:malate dehydrogenase (oxaloacetate-decarboxylating)